MECVLVICRKNKSIERKGKVLFIDAKNEIRLERSEAFLKKEHIERIKKVYKNYVEEDGFSKIVENENILEENNGNLSIPLYIQSYNNEEQIPIPTLINTVSQRNIEIFEDTNNLLSQLNKFGL